MGFKAQAAHWLTAAHWRDGEGKREGRVEEEWSGVGDGVNGDGEVGRGAGIIAVRPDDLRVK